MLLSVVENAKTAESELKSIRMRYKMRLKTQIELPIVEVVPWKWLLGHRCLKM